MTDEEILATAESVGLLNDCLDVETTSFCILAFAKQVAKLERHHEREACAKVCETHGVHPALNVWNGGPDWYKHGKNCAAAIRARGEQA